MNGIRTIHTVVRKCGYRAEYGLYATGGDGTPDGVLPRFVPINPPIPYQVPVHRGPRIVDADAVLNRQPMAEWWMGSSKETEINKQGDAWAEEVFGMSIHRRLQIGETAGTKTADEALAYLVGKVAYHPNIVRSFDKLTREKAQEIPRVTPHYTALHAHLLTYTKTQAVGELMGVQAAVWRMAYTVAPSKREKVIPILLEILVYMNLRKDAIAMRQTFLAK